MEMTASDYHSDKRDLMAAIDLEAYCASYEEAVGRKSLTIYPRSPHLVATDTLYQDDGGEG